MTEVAAYLVFNGNCAEAMLFYQKTLGGKLDMQTFGDAPIPEEIRAGSTDRIIHARLELDHGVLMASDGPASETVPAMNGFAVSVNYSSVAEAKKVFEALSSGGSVTMPMAETFWSPAFGMCTDRFGTPWMVNVTRQ